MTLYNERRDWKIHAWCAAAYLLLSALNGFNLFFDHWLPGKIWFFAWTLLGVWCFTGSAETVRQIRRSEKQKPQA